MGGDFLGNMGKLGKRGGGYWFCRLFYVCIPKHTKESDTGRSPRRGS